MKRRRIAVACQGGGSQCAFVAGALKGLFSQGFQHRFNIVGLSGTSGGALTAGLAWAALLDQMRGEYTGPIEDRIIAFWRDLAAQTPLERMLDHFMIESIRLTERGVLPSFATSPSSYTFRWLSEMTSLIIGRPEYTDLRALIAKHFDFSKMSAAVDPEAPVLLVGAADVPEGTFKIFSSDHNEITIDSLLASAAIPNLFPAVWVDGHAYWDGIFSSNPPIAGFLQKIYMGKHALPDEIWIIQVNRSESDSVPEMPSDIFDRRNHLAGNLSLRHELRLLEMVNMLLQEGALTDRFRARFGLEASVPITVRFIRMSHELQRGLDYPSKLSRQPDHIENLIAHGEAQAKSFLSALRDDDRPAGSSELGMPVGAP